MSKKKINTFCIVVDASIARAAGPPASAHPTGARCRDFLFAVRSVCHRMAWNAAIKVEWDKHQSQFAAQWRLTMMSLGKLRPVGDAFADDLREAIEAHSDDNNVTKAMLKDAHLIEAAMATDRRLTSLDDTVRGHMGRLSATHAPLQTVVWVNPAVHTEHAVAWVEDGAPADRSRRLKP